ncbi:MAG: type II secretion system F family protein [Candidatus Bathyarchaeota archaeon]|nr:type II secretion system F family protein [Candidatus Bathyarchaeota archaeon]
MKAAPRSGASGKVFGLLNRATSEEREKTEAELPFAVMIFTLMAASGISPYDSWKKMRKLSFLPIFKKEADEVVRQVEVLGKDPLTVMYQRAEVTQSKLYRNFLGGFVSSVRSGGKLVDYMKSQLKSIFELRYINLNRSIERIAALVEAYSVMLIVVLCTYILFVVFSSSSVMDLLSSTSITISPAMSYIIAFIIMPVMSGFFIMIAHNMQRSAFPDLKDLYRRALMFIIPAFVVIGLFASVSALQEAIKPLGLPEVATIALVGATTPLAIQYYRIAKINYNAEESIPSFIRDITESQKTGLSPEKSIVQATKRKDYGSFTKFLELIRSQIEWGIPLRKTFENIRKDIRSWFVVVNFAMMVETLEIGGNSIQSLEILSEYSEKERELQVNRRALLKPYILLAFMWSALIAVTTTIVALTTTMMTGIVSSDLSSIATIAMQDQLKLFSVGIIIQCWISGFFIGKISEGNFGAGFKIAAMLSATAYLSLVLSQVLLAGAFTIVPINPGGGGFG